MESKGGAQLHHLLTIIIGVYLTLLSLPIYSETLVVAAKRIEGMVDGRHKGLLIEQLRAIEKISDYTFTILVLPPARAVHMFEKGEADILLPHPFKTSPYSASMYTKESYIFFRKGDVLLKAYSDLKGKSVAVTRGFHYNYHEIKKYTDNIIVVSGDEIALRMLNHGRVDAVVGEKQSLLDVINEESLNRISFIEGAPVEAQGVYLQFATSKMLDRQEREINQLLSNL